MLNEKQRLLYALKGAEFDRPPVICLGGPMSAAVSELLELENLDFASLHSNAGELARAAIAIARHTGFECVGLPLCATVEAEALASTITPGGRRTEPRVAKERYLSIDEVTTIDIDAALEKARVPVLIEAVAIASEDAPEMPVIANVLGPVTLAASLVEPTALLRAMIDKPVQVHALLEQLRQFLSLLIGRLAVAGADVVAIHEDVGDPKSVGPRLFGTFAVHHLQWLVGELRGASTPVATAGHAPLCVCPACRVTTALEGMRRRLPVIVHCCELSPPAWPLLARVGATAWSVGHATSIGQLLEAHPELLVIGNISTNLIDNGPLSRIESGVARAKEAGAIAIAPACGLAMGTPLLNIQGFTEAARKSPAVAANPVSPSNGAA